MKFQISQIKTLDAAITAIKSTVLPIRTAYKFSLLAREVNKSFEFFQGEMKKLFDAYGQRDENGQFKTAQEGGYILIKPECVAEANKKADEINNFEVDLPDIQFTLDELEAASLSIEQMTALLPFISGE